MVQVVWKCLTLLLLFSTHRETPCSEFSYVRSELAVSRLRSEPLLLELNFPAMHDAALTALERRVVHAASIAQHKMGAEFKDSFAIFFDPRPPFHNGLTTVIPTNRINVHLQAPELESSIGLFRDYLTETLVHEMSHMIVTQSRSGIFRALDYVVGNTARPLGSWPRWLHEGMAVWTEAAVGGRPASGQIDFELRQYADYVSRNKKHPIGNSDLDGNNTVERSEAGAFPYYFGYLMVNEWHRLRQAKAWGPLFYEWAKSPGLSFRVLFRNDHKITLDKFFEDQQKSWAAHPLKVPGLLRGELWSKAQRIAGPYSYRFQNTDKKPARSLAWIEFQGNSGPILKGKWSNKKLESLVWNLGYAVPQQVFLSERGWLVRYSQLSEIANARLSSGIGSARSFVGFFDRAGKQICRLHALPERLKEVAFYEQELAYIVSDSFGGAQSVWRARFDNACGVSDQTRIADAAEPFQRLSSLVFEAGEITYSRHSVEAPYEIVERDGKKIFLSDSPLSLAFRWGNYWVAHRYSRDTFAPILFSENRKSARMVESKFLPLRTGSKRSALGSLDEESGKKFLLVKESIWEEDRLVKVDLADFSAQGPLVEFLPKPISTNFLPPASLGSLSSSKIRSSDLLKNKDSSTSAPSIELRRSEKNFNANIEPGELPARELSPSATLEKSSSESPDKSSDKMLPSNLKNKQAYSVWPSIIPQFWLPTAAAYSGGFVAYGQTFFSDLTEQWSGSLAGGYDSYTMLPFGNFSLSRKGGWIYPFSSHSFSCYYAPSAVTLPSGKLVFQRSGAELGSALHYFARSPTLKSSMNFGLRYEFGRGEFASSNFSYLSPSIQLNVSSPQTLSSSSPGFRLAQAVSGASATVRARTIRGPEYFAALQGVVGLGHSAFLLRSEWAKTAQKNYPASYFEFGGNYPFTTSMLSFLSRGFAPRLGVARELIRGEFQWGFVMARLNQGLSWNRLRMRQLDARLIAESVTFAPFKPRDYSLGNGYFSTVGAEFDLFGTLSQYIKYTATVGVYHGFGIYGENRLGLRITSYLDL